MQDPTRVRVALDEIRSGAICKSDINDRDGAVFLNRGCPLTETVLEQIRDRGIAFLEVDPQDAGALRGETSDPKAKPERKRESKTDRSGKLQRSDRTDQRYSPARMEQFRSQVNAATQQVAQIGSQF